MKLNSALIVWAFAAIFILAAGCTSFSGDGGPGANSQNPPVTTVASPGPAGHGSSSQNMHQGLTEAQKTQATSILKADATMKDVLNRPGYGIMGMDAGTDAFASAIVTIHGGDVLRADGSMWTPDQYTVIVDLDHGRVADIIHVEPKPLPTPKPL